MPRIDHYNYNNYVSDIYNNDYHPYRNYMIPSYLRNGMYKSGVIHSDDIDYFDEDGIEYEVIGNDIGDSDYVIYFFPDKDEEVEEIVNEVQEAEDVEEEMVAAASEIHENAVGFSRLPEKVHEDTIERLEGVTSDEEQGTNKTKRHDDSNEVIPPGELFSFSFEDFDEDGHVDINTLTRFRDYILMVLARRRNKNNPRDVQANDNPNYPRSNRQNTNFIRDFIHKNIARRNYPGQEYDENHEHKPRQQEVSTIDRVRNMYRNRFRPRDLVTIETGPSIAKFTLTGRGRKLENPKVYVIDNKNCVKDFNELCISDQHAVLEDGLRNCNVYLGYPAKVKVEEHKGDMVEVIVMRSVVQSMMDRYTESFFNTTMGKVFAKRFYNAILL